MTGYKCIIHIKEYQRRKGMESTNYNNITVLFKSIRTPFRIFDAYCIAPSHEVIELPEKDTSNTSFSAGFIEVDLLIFENF